MSKKSATRSISIGFVIVILLLIILTSIAALRLSAIDRSQERFVQQDTVKFEILQAMRKIVRERTLTMLTMVRRTDPFDLDDEFMHFNQLAREFIKLRHRFEKIKIHPDEKILFDRAMALIRVSAPLQDRIIQDIVNGRIGKSNVLIERDITLEKKLWSVFDELIAASQVHLKNVATANERENRRASATIVILGILAVIIAIIAMVRVIQHAGNYQRALRGEKEFAEMTLSSIGDAVIATDYEGNITFINLAAQKMLGYTTVQTKGKSLRRFFDILSEDSRHKENHLAFEDFMDGPAVSVSRYHVLKLANGSECIIEDVVSPMHDGDGNFLGNTVIFRDVTQTRLIEQQLSWRALHDPLTGLANRFQLETRLKETLVQAKRNNNEHVLLMIDLDNFKPVNDTCGHMAGDMLLKKIANTLTQKMRKSDTLARLGGDEFVVLLDGCALKQAESIAETLRSEIQNLDFTWEGHSFKVGASIGLSLINSSCTTTETIMKQADDACYSAKKAGRNRINVYSLKTV